MKNQLKDRVMLPLKYWPTIFLYSFMSHPAVARDLESIATNLTSKTSSLVGKIVPVGFAIAGAFMIFGSPKGATFISGTLMAAFLALGATSIFSWLKNIVG